MDRRQPTTGNDRLGHASPPSMASETGLTSSSASAIRRQQLEKSVSWSGREWLRCLWYRLRLELADINYANRRLIELQIPWTADPQWHMKSGSPFPR